MEVSEAAAWWGAIVATLVLAWDVFKWKKSRYSVAVSASPNMSIFNQLEGELDDDKFIYVEVINRGDKVITLTHLVTKHYSDLWHLIRRKPDMQGAILQQQAGHQQIPFELEPGKRWTGQIDQKDVEEKSGTSGFFYCGVYHTASDNAVLVRVKLE